MASFSFLALNCSAFETFGFGFLNLDEDSEEASKSEEDGKEGGGEVEAGGGGASHSWVEVEVGSVVRKWKSLDGDLPLDLLPRGDIVVVCLG